MIEPRKPSPRVATVLAASSAFLAFGKTAETIAYLDSGSAACGGLPSVRTQLDLGPLAPSRIPLPSETPQYVVRPEPHASARSRARELNVTAFSRDSAFR